MSSYVGKHAEYYDIFYSDKPYQEEAGFLDRQIKKFSSVKAKKVLELACGTGSHALCMEKIGYEVSASDYSESMIAEANKKALKNLSQINFRVSDMRKLSTPREKFDVVLCMFDAIGYVLTNEGINKVFSGVHNNLVNDGLFVFEFWHAGAMIRGYSPLRKRKFNIPGGEILRISETSLEIDKQVASVKYSIYDFSDNGRCNIIEETQKNRYFLVPEMSFYLESNGFEIVKMYDGFSENENITLDTWHVVAVARKK